MIYDQVKPNTSGWNQIISEFERNMKIFLLLQESPEEAVREMAKQNAELMKDAYHNMHCIVDKDNCKCDDIQLITEKKPLPSNEDLRKWQAMISEIQEYISKNEDLTNSQRLKINEQLNSLQKMDFEKLEEIRELVHEIIQSNLKEAQKNRTKTVETNKKILLTTITESNLDKKTKNDFTKKTESVDASAKDAQTKLESLNNTLQEKIAEKSQTIDSETSNPDNPDKK